jgi:hypothetical protein
MLVQTWLVGKWLSPREQRWAAPGTHFHQFVVPPIIGFRQDCTYGKLAAMRLPKDVQGVGSCEVCINSRSDDHTSPCTLKPINNCKLC